MPGYILISSAAMLRWLHFVTMWIIEGAPILSGFLEGAKYLKSALPHKRKWVLQQVAAVVSGILTVSVRNTSSFSRCQHPWGHQNNHYLGARYNNAFEIMTRSELAPKSQEFRVQGGIQGLRIFGHLPNASIERAQAPIQWFFALGESPLRQAEKNQGYTLGTAMQWQLPQGYMEGWRLLWICDEKSHLLSFLLQRLSNWLSTRLSATFFRWDLDVLDLLPQQFQICFRSSHLIVLALISWFQT